MKTTTDSAPLLARTQALVSNAPRCVTFTMMAQKAGVSVAWISRFANGQIPNPGVNTVQRLHDYLITVERGT